MTIPLRLRIRLRAAFVRAMRAGNCIHGPTMWAEASKGAVAFNEEACAFLYEEARRQVEREKAIAAGGELP